MNDDPTPPTEAPPQAYGPGARRKRRRSPWGRRLAWSLGLLVAVIVIAAFSLRLWVERYLKSPAFAARLNDTAGNALAADCQLEDLSWQGSTGYAGTFTAMGRGTGLFRRLSVADVRAELDIGAIWDRVWRVNHVKIAQITADFSAGGRPAATPQPLPDAAAPNPPHASGGWFQGWLPNRTEIGPVQVDRFDFKRAGDDSMKAVSGSGFSLVLKPNLKTTSLEIEGRSGEIDLPGLEPPLKVARMRTTVRPGDASLDRLEGTIADAALTAEGTIGLQTPGDLRLNLRLTGASLGKWLPEDWLKRCNGLASGSATLRGDWRQPETVRAEGDFKIIDATLQALPLLDIISKKTQNASFLRMQIKEATGKFDRRRAGEWELRQLRADAPGLLRLKGGVEVGTGGTLRGALLLGIVPGTLRYLAGAEQTVFITAERFSDTAGHAGLLSADDGALLWTRFQLGGTLDEPGEDLSERLALAWFNATVDEVAGLSMEAAATVTRNAAGAAKKIIDTAAPPLLDKAPDVLNQAPDLLNQGVKGGLKVLDGLLPR